MNVVTTQNLKTDDGNERVGAAHVGRLQRAIVRLAFLFHGQNPILDERLKRLGALLKSSPRSAGVLSLIDEIVEQLVSLDLSRGNTAFASGQLADLVGQLQPGPECADEIRALQHRLAETRDRDDLERLRNEAITCINRSLKPRAGASEADRAPPHGGPELLVKMLGSLRTTGDLKTAVDGLRGRIEQMRTHKAWLDAADEAAALLSRAFATGASLPGAETIEALKGGLLRVLERVHRPGDEDHALDAVRNLVAQAATPEELMGAARAFGDALAQARSSLERKVAELSGFLRSVIRRLEDFRANLSVSDRVHGEAMQSAIDLQQSMHEQVEQIRDRVDVETNLDDLKDYVLREMNGLENALSSFVDTQRDSHQHARENVGSALDRLSSLESEIAQLRTDLKEQHTLSLLDPLTGVYNRLGYSEGIAREYARWQRHGGQLSLAIFDIDHFKSINDQYGHATGDKVLTAVAALLRRQVRSSDLICRFGGEEFVLVMPETVLDAAMLVAEKLRLGIAGSQFRFKEDPVPVTVSCGVATFENEDAIEDVFERADRALYRAKHEGRNRTCVGTKD